MKYIEFHIRAYDLQEYHYNAGGIFPINVWNLQATFGTVINYSKRSAEMLNTLG